MVDPDKVNDRDRCDPEPSGSADSGGKTGQDGDQGKNK